MEKLTQRASWSYSFAKRKNIPPFSSNKVLDKYYLSAVSNDTILTHASAGARANKRGRIDYFRVVKSFRSTHCIFSSWMFFSAMYHDFAMSQTESVYVTKGGEVTDLNWNPSLSCEIYSFSLLFSFV